MRTLLSSLGRIVSFAPSVSIPSLPTQCSVKCTRPLIAISSTRPPRQSCIQQRAFKTSPTLRKKGGRAVGKEPAPEEAGEDGPDPFDFTALENDLEKVIERLKNDLSGLRGGGRFNPESVGNLRVQPDKNDKATYKVSDLASIVPKGRVLNILVGEKEHLKPITTAIQSSNLSLTPQPDPTGANPVLLVIQIPPPTAESRKAVVQEAIKLGDRATAGVRDARGRQQKKHRALEKIRSVRRDDTFKAAGQWEKIVEKANADVKKFVDNAKKVLESG